MDEQKVDLYIMSNRNYFPVDKVSFIREKLMETGENNFDKIMFIELKSPDTIFLVSILLGYLGVDRFLLGDVGFGLLKLLLSPCCLLSTPLVVYDWFTITQTTREHNFKKIVMML